jgi:hypothetical protein
MLTWCKWIEELSERLICDSRWKDVFKNACVLDVTICSRLSFGPVKIWFVCNRARDGEFENMASTRADDTRDHGCHRNVHQFHTNWMALHSAPSWISMAWTIRVIPNASSHFGRSWFLIRSNLLCAVQGRRRVCRVSEIAWFISTRPGFTHWVLGFEFQSNSSTLTEPFDILNISNLFCLCGLFLYHLRTQEIKIHEGDVQGEVWIESNHQVSATKELFIKNLMPFERSDSGLTRSAAVVKIFTMKFVLEDFLWMFLKQKSSLY